MRLDSLRHDIEGEKQRILDFLRRNFQNFDGLDAPFSARRKVDLNRRKAKRRVSRLHARVANLRREHQHKISNDLDLAMARLLWNA